MLKGLILAAAVPEDWKEKQKKEGLLLAEPERRTPASSSAETKKICLPRL